MHAINTTMPKLYSVYALHVHYMFIENSLKKKIHKNLHVQFPFSCQSKDRILFVPMVMSDWRKDELMQKVGLKFALTVIGVVCVTLAGTILMQEWFVSTSVSLETVRTIYTHGLSEGLSNCYVSSINMCSYWDCL